MNLELLRRLAGLPKVQEKKEEAPADAAPADAPAEDKPKLDFPAVVIKTALSVLGKEEKDLTAEDCGPFNKVYQDGFSAGVASTKEAPAE